MMGGEYDAFREQLRADTLAAFGIGQPSRRARLTRWLPGRRRMARRMIAMERAAAESRAREEAFAAALPDRMQGVIDALNEQIRAALPEGVRFEWYEPGARP
jgi:hypothetical protein